MGRQALPGDTVTQLDGLTVIAPNDVEGHARVNRNAVREGVRAILLPRGQRRIARWLVVRIEEVVNRDTKRGGEVLELRHGGVRLPRLDLRDQAGAGARSLRELTHAELALLVKLHEPLADRGGRCHLYLVQIAERSAMLYRGPSKLDAGGPGAAAALGDGHDRPASSTK
jgi:hypothetical protein